jgi:preprotein translocase subunit SecF
MSLLRDLYRGTTSFDFVGSRRIWFTLSAAIVALSVISFGLRGGFDLSVDFQGGTLVEMENPNGASVGEVRELVLGRGVAGARVQATGGGEGIRVQAAQLTPEDEQVLVESLAALTGSDAAEASRQSVGPTFGRQITDSAIRALVVFLVVAALFIAWRLEWKMALIAMLALVHDMLFTGGVYALVGFEVSPATVIAILTILGYSLYDTVVVFDKVLENVRERGDKQTISSIVNMSMNQVFMRSLNTSLTSLLPIGSLLFVGSFLLGATTLREFALALFIGVAVGTYSSVFLAGPLLAVWKEREDHWLRVRRRVERKGGDAAFETRSVFATAEAEVAEPITGGGAVPRPPKKRRKKR